MLMLQRTIKYLLPTVAFLLLTACSSQYDKLLRSQDYKLKYEKAKEYFTLKKYERAATLYEQTAMYFRGTPQDDTVNFFLAKSYYSMSDMYSAEYYFNQFRNTFPRSPFAEEASYLRVVSLYRQTNRFELDQTPTQRTLSAIEEFEYTYPRSSYKEENDKIRESLLQRLDEKGFEAAKLYYVREDYKASTTALRTLLNDNPDTRYREEVLYLLVASAYKYAANSYRFLQKDRYQAVVDEYFNFVSEFPESKYRKEVEKWNTSALKSINTDRTKKEKEYVQPEQSVEQ